MAIHRTSVAERRSDGLLREDYVLASLENLLRREGDRCVREDDGVVEDDDGVVSADDRGVSADDHRVTANYRCVVVDGVVPVTENLLRLPFCRLGLAPFVLLSSPSLFVEEDGVSIEGTCRFVEEQGLFGNVPGLRSLAAGS